MGSSTEGLGGGTPMRFPLPVQRFVAPVGSPPMVPVAELACSSPAQYNVSWPQRELHRRRYPQLRQFQLPV
eukprot:9095164-Pyramimonas_sp.AAC.1